MSKYVIELRPDCKVVQQICESNGQVSIGARSIQYLEELNSDYINEHFGGLREESYQKGYEDGKKNNDKAYQRGLDDAWEAATKIVGDTEHGGITLGALGEIFGASSYSCIMRENTAQEAITKLKAYEEKQKEEDSIKVGDEVIYNGTTRCIVVRPETEERYASLFDCNGYHHSADHRECKKTGRRFSIGEILEAMKNG